MVRQFFLLEIKLMKLMTLNIWGGHVYEPLIAFIKKHQDIDVFCFQEVYHQAKEIISTEDRFHHVNIFSEIENALPEHQGFFRAVVNHIYGIAIFVKKNIEVLNEGEIVIHENRNYPGKGPTHSRILQWIECRLDNQTYAILNVHGLWNGKGKTDSPERLYQSQRIRDFMQTLNIPIILCGDFNLRPDTESMHILEKNMNNLIKTYGITSTRTRLYEKEEKFADYILVSKNVSVKDFKVLPEEVSDHTALLLTLI